MADPLKQLTIKTGSVRRLGSDFRSYKTERDSYQSKLTQAINQSNDQYEVKKYRELVEECVATMHEILEKLNESINQLDSFMHQHTQLVGTVEWEKAQKILNENRAQINESITQSSSQVINQSSNQTKPQHDEKKSVSQSNSQSSTQPIVGPQPVALRNIDIGDKFVVAVYGSSQTQPDDPVYQSTRALGQMLASNQFHIVNGGYHGVMEAVSEGASLVEGASIEGIISPSAFPSNDPSGNKYLTHITITEDLPQRVIAFLSRCNAFIVLPGSVGTLTELAITWDCSAVSALRGQQPLPILAMKEPWQKVIEALKGLIPISPFFLEKVTFVESNEEIIEKLKQAREQWKRDTA